MIINNNDSLEVNKVSGSKSEKEPKTITIIVNGQEVIVPAKPKEISYEQVVKIAYPEYKESNSIIYTVAYSKGPSENQKGTLVKGQTVKLKKEMIFNVGCSSRS